MKRGTDDGYRAWVARQAARPRRLVPSALRRSAAAVAVLGGADVAVLAVAYHGTGMPSALDSWIVARLLGGVRDRGHVLDDVVRLTTPPPIIALGIVLAALACAVRAWRAAALAILGPGVTGAVVEVLKQLVGRTMGGSPALPSGQTAGATAVAITVALLLLSGRERVRPIVGGVAGLAGVTLVALLVGTAMTVLRLHYATDTVAGFGAALAVTIGVAFGIDALADRCGPSAGSASG